LIAQHRRLASTGQPGPIQGLNGDGPETKIPGCVDTTMDGKLRSDSLVAGNFPYFWSGAFGRPARKCLRLREFFDFWPRLPPPAQGISNVGAGNLKWGSREFLLAQRAWFEPSLEREKATEATTRIFSAPEQDWLRTPASPYTLEGGPIGESGWPPPNA
jgi:hypothetical protein